MEIANLFSLIAYKVVNVCNVPGTVTSKYSAAKG